MSDAVIWTGFPFHDAKAAENMALDCALARHAGTHGMALVRFYRFAVPSITIGRFQSATDLDWCAVRAAGIPVARRPTGGRALFHDNALTWAVALPFAPERSRRAVFSRVMDRLVAALDSLGIATRLAPGGRRPATAGCFDSLAEWELCDSAGRKIAPAAQAVGRRAVLVHGILPLDAGYRRIGEYLEKTSRPLAESGGAGPGDTLSAQRIGKTADGRQPAAVLSVSGDALLAALDAAFAHPAGMPAAGVALIERSAAACVGAFRVADPAGPEYPLQEMPAF